MKLFIMCSLMRCIKSACTAARDPTNPVTILFAYLAHWSD